MGEKVFEGMRSCNAGYPGVPAKLVNFRKKVVTERAPPPWRQPRGKYMVPLVNFNANATSSRLHLWEIDFKFALKSTQG